jgi:hypothetical protein
VPVEGAMAQVAGSLAGLYSRYYIRSSTFWREIIEGPQKGDWGICEEDPEAVRRGRALVIGNGNRQQ